MALNRSQRFPKSLRSHSQSRLLEPVSKPLEDRDGASQFKESEKKKTVTLVAHNKATIVEQPTDRAFDPPTSFVASKWPSVLSCRAFAAASVWTNQFNATLCQPLSQGITVGRFVINQSLGALRHTVRLFKSGSMRLTSAGLALAMSTPSGVPRPSMRSMIFVPLPRFVLPTQSPLFWPGKTCRRPSPRPSGATSFRRAGGAVGAKRSGRFRFESTRVAAASRSLGTESMLVSLSTVHHWLTPKGFLPGTGAVGRGDARRLFSSSLQETDPRSEAIAHRWMRACTVQTRVSGVQRHA